MAKNGNSLLSNSDEIKEHFLGIFVHLLSKVTTLIKTRKNRKIHHNVFSTQLQTEMEGEVAKERLPECRDLLII